MGFRLRRLVPWVVAALAAALAALAGSMAFEDSCYRQLEPLERGSTVWSELRFHLFSERCYRTAPDGRMVEATVFWWYSLAAAVTVAGATWFALAGLLRVVGARQAVAGSVGCLVGLAIAHLILVT